MNALCQWKVTLEKINVDADTLWFLKLKEFLGFANQIKDLKLDVDWDEVCLYIPYKPVLGIAIFFDYNIF